MKRRIVIQQVTLTPDGSGGNTRSWTTFATVWAEIKPMSAKERYFSGRREHNVTHKINMRYKSGLTTAMRISWNSRIFQIHGIINVDEESRFMKLDCEEGVQE